MISVFLSGPNDCSSEKSIVAKEVTKLALILQEAYGIDLRLLTFENDTFSAMGTDGQDVVNTQIGDSYDVYLGLINLRLGTQTPRDESGTAEEYQRALTRYRTAGKPAMLFFEMNPVFKKSDIDTTELTRVQNFVKRVRADGMLTKTVTLEELDIVVYTHLYKTLNASGLLKNDITDSKALSDEEFRIVSEELKVLSDSLHNAQRPMHENTVRQAEVIGRLEGRPDSWFAKWIRFGNNPSNNFILLMPQSDEQIREATNELNSIALEMQNLLRDYRPKYRNYIEASVKMFSHPIKKRGIIGIDEYFIWANNFQSLLLLASQKFMETARNYQTLHDLSPSFAEAKAEIISMLKTMAADYLTSRELLQIVVQTAMDVSKTTK